MLLRSIICIDFRAQKGCVSRLRVPGNLALGYLKRAFSACEPKPELLPCSGLKLPSGGGLYLQWGYCSPEHRLRVYAPLSL